MESLELRSRTWQRNVPQMPWLKRILMSFSHFLSYLSTGKRLSFGRKIRRWICRWRWRWCWPLRRQSRLLSKARTTSINYIKIKCFTIDVIREDGRKGFKTLLLSFFLHHKWKLIALFTLNLIHQTKISLSTVSTEFNHRFMLAKLLKIAETTGKLENCN